MQQGILIFTAVISFAINGIMTRHFQLYSQRSKQSIYLYEAFFSLVAAITYLLTAILTTGFSVNMLFPATIFGACFCGAIIFSAFCNELGFMSISSVIVNLSMLCPILFSWVFLKEPVYLNSAFGLILLTLTFVMSSVSSRQENKGSFRSWLLFVSIAFFANGFSAVTQKQYSLHFGGNQIMGFMGIAYLVSTLIFTGLFLSKNRGMGFSEQVKNPCRFFLICAASGLGSFCGNALLGYLCTKVNGGILYPCINGGLCVVTALAAFLLFREKVLKTKLIAIASGIVAIVLLNLS